ncbi:MAG TPA: hypothetical protein VGF21_08770 [Thermoleophilaceae bacterium]
MNAFHVCGGILACWALILSFIGITREDFPSSSGTAKLVGAISVVLVVAAIFSAIYVGATENEETGSSGQTAVLLPL